MSILYLQLGYYHKHRLAVHVQDTVRKGSNDKPRRSPALGSDWQKAVAIHIKQLRELDTQRNVFVRWSRASLIRRFYIRIANTAMLTILCHHAGMDWPAQALYSWTATCLSVSLVVSLATPKSVCLACQWRSLYVHSYDRLMHAMSGLSGLDKHSCNLPDLLTDKPMHKQSYLWVCSCMRLHAMMPMLHPCIAYPFAVRSDQKLQKARTDVN